MINQFCFQCRENKCCHSEKEKEDYYKLAIDNMADDITRALFGDDVKYPAGNRVLSHKQILLRDLYSVKRGYKKLALSPIRYGGGKSHAVGHIIEYFPPVKRLISPFFGGGSIEFVMEKKLGVDVIASDLNEDLVNYWTYQFNDPESLFKELNQLEPTKEQYDLIRKILKEYKDGNRKLSNLERATYFVFNHNLSYGPGFIGYASYFYLNRKKYRAMINKVKKFRSNVKITCESFENLFEKYPYDFFYCDPPYFLKQDCDSSEVYAGIYPAKGYSYYHDNFDHELLRDRIYNHKGKFVLSYNNCKKSKEYYRDYRLEYPDWVYTMGLGEKRVSKKKGNQRRNYMKKCSELLIIKT